MPGVSDQSDGQGQPAVRLVGREREIGLLRDQLRRVLDGHGRLVLVSGEAGIGKTTLVSDLARRAETRGCLVLRGHVYDLSVTPPYGPWLEMLRQYPGATVGLPPLPDLVQATPSQAAGSQDALFSAVASFLQSVALRRPIVLVLDDLHWSDQGSLDFLRYLARQIDNHRILLLATYRSDELHRHHPLYAVLPLVVRESGAERLEVRPLDSEAHRALIASRYSMDDEDAARLEQYLQAHAEGNPLFALELLRNLEEEGVLRLVGDAWSIGDLAQVRIPPLLRQVIERRLARLGDRERSLLQVAAIIGQEVSLDLLQQVTQEADEALVTAIEQGQAAHLLVEIPGGASYRFQHALLREALYESVVSLRRRRWHLKVAEALATQARPVPDIIAHHFQQAGDVRAVAWLLESAKRARMIYATATAIDRLETALALDEQHDGGSGLRGWLLAALAGWGAFLANVDERMRLFNEAMDIALRTGDEALAGLIEWSRADIEINFFAPVVEALCSARDRIQRLPPEEQARLDGFIYGAVGVALDPVGPEMTCIIIGLQAQSGQYHEALASAKQIRADFTTLSPTAELSISNAFMACHLALGRPDDALLYNVRIVDTLRRRHISDWVAVLMWIRLRDLTLVYWPDRVSMRQVVADEAVEAIQRAKADQTFSADTPDEYGIVWLLLIEGHWDDALRVLEQSTAEFFSSYSTGGPWMVLMRYQGNPGAALARLSLVFPDGPQSEPGRVTFETAVLCMHAVIEIALDAGDRELARSWLECHDRWIKWSGHVPFTTVTHLLWARYHRVLGNHDIARECASRALARAREPRQPLYLLAAHRLLGELDTESGAFADAHRHLAEALALADDCQAPFERALTLIATGELTLARGDIDAARQQLIEARAICEPLHAMPALARIAELELHLSASSTPRYPAGLSPREVEVLRLVAQGLTDAQVAEQLFLSPRTVSQHLRSVYNKLGINSRTAATRFAFEHDLT
jgi:DNA-binding CsgD family transcriptional regulator/uncharacterized tellurite resistance protein B-like protein